MQVCTLTWILIKTARKGFVFVSWFMKKNWNRDCILFPESGYVYSNPDFLHILICLTRREHCIVHSNFFTYWLHFCMYQFLHLQGFGYFVWIYISKCKRFFLFRMQFSFAKNLNIWNIGKFHIHKNVFVWEKAAKTSFALQR